MKITKEEVVHVAELARLDMDESAIESVAVQIDHILEYIDTLNRVNTDGVPPTSHAIFITNAFREDQPRDHLDRQEALANAPDREDGFFLVPKVIG